MCKFFRLTCRLVPSGKNVTSLSKNYFTSSRTCGLPPTILSNIFKETTRRSTGLKNTCFDKKEIQRAVSSEHRPCLRDELLCKVTDSTRDGFNKVTIVGAGMVGIACVNAILFQKISSHVAIVDAFPKKLEGEGMDFSHGITFLDDPRVEYDTDFCVTSNSKVVIVAAGARQKKGETRLDLVQRNSDIFKSIIPPLVKYSPNAVFIIASNPVDIMSWLTWQISGLPINRIIGSGCHLDTARLRYMIGDRIGVAPSSVNGYIIGEHGESQVPLWSSFSISGVLLRDILPNIGLESDEEEWNEIAKDVIKSGPTVRCLKGYSNTAIGLCVADITRDVLCNSLRVKSVSTLIQGHHDIPHEMYLSLPCIIGESGVSQVVRMRMTEYEKKLFETSANAVYNVQKSIKAS